MSARIEAVTLDAAGTLIGVARPVGETYAAIARAHGAALERDALARGFRDEFPRMRPMAFGRLAGAALDIAERDWWRELVRRVTDRAGGVTGFDAYFDALYAHYASRDAWRLYDEVPGVLRRLAARGVPVAVVSNFDSRLPGILDALGVGGLVTAVVHSTAAGAAKPDARIFHAALAALGTRAARTLHAGDSHAADYRGALGAGMQAVHLVRGGAPRDGDAVRITDLDALDAVLDGKRAAAVQAQNGHT